MTSQNSVAKANRWLRFGLNHLHSTRCFHSNWLTLLAARPSRSWHHRLFPTVPNSWLSRNVSRSIVTQTWRPSSQIEIRCVKRDKCFEIWIRTFKVQTHPITKELSDPERPEYLSDVRSDKIQAISNAKYVIMFDHLIGVIGLLKLHLIHTMRLQYIRSTWWLQNQDLLNTWERGQDLKYA